MIIALGEWGVYVHINYDFDLCSVATSMEKLMFIRETEERFKNIIEDELTDELWIAHSKDLHMWHDNAKKAKEKLDEELAKEYGEKKGPPSQETPTSLPSAADANRKTFLANAWKEAALHHDDKRMMYLDVSDVVSQCVQSGDDKPVIEGVYRVDAVRYLYCLNISYAYDFVADDDSDLYDKDDNTDDETVSFDSTDNDGPTSTKVRCMHL